MDSRTIFILGFNHQHNLGAGGSIMVIQEEEKMFALIKIKTFM